MTFFIFSLLFTSCLYKAGNRQPDLNYRIPLNINSFYVEKYLKQRWMKNIYESPLNSELVNYPEDFIPITDSIKGIKYVIEDRVSENILNNNGWGLSLSSLYDFNKKQWVTDRDSLSKNDLENFKAFFKDSILVNVVHRYIGTIPDSLLFIEGSNIIKIKELH